MASTLGGRNTVRVSQRQVIKIAVRPEAKTIIAAFAEKNGMTETTLASRIYEWFADQDDALRKGVLGILPEGYELDVARVALERMTATKKSRR